MPEALPDYSHGLWSLISLQLEERMGLYYGPAQWPQMQRGLQAAATHFGCTDGVSCAQWLLSQARWSRAETDVLARHLAIGESYFFRDEAFFQCLEKSILPELLRERRSAGRRLRIWSAGCSTGEEAYSVAMLLATMVADWRDWDISILASDINEQALARGRSGIYGSWSLRPGIPASCRKFLIEQGAGRHEVDPALRAMVSFSSINLAQDEYPSRANATLGMDLVLCRNVLIYFEPARALSVLAALGRSLRPGGWLITGAVEMPLCEVQGLERVNLGGIVVLRPMTEGLGQASPVLRQSSVPQREQIAETSLMELSKSIAPPTESKPDAPVAHEPVIASEPPARDFVLKDDAKPDLAAMARIHADKGELEQAARLCSQAIDGEKDNADLSYLLATILLEQGEHPQALAALRRTLYLCPGHVLAHLALGAIARESGDIEASHRHIERAATLAGDAGQAVLAASGGMAASQVHAAIGATSGNRA